MQHVAEIGGADLDPAAGGAGDAEADAVAERQGDKRLRSRAVLCLLPHPYGLCGQQCLVVQRHADAAVLRNELLEIYLLGAKHRRPDEHRRCRVHKPLAADRYLENVVPVDARAARKPCEAGKNRAAE